MSSRRPPSLPLPSPVTNLSQRAMKNVAIIGMIVIVAAITVQVARGSESVSTLREPVGRIGQITHRLREVSADIIPNPSTAPLITYLSRCTAPGDRVLVAGFGPEIPVLAHRPFAGGFRRGFRGITTTVRMSHAQSVD